MSDTNNTKMTLKERFEIRKMIFKNNLKIQYHKMIMRKNMIKILFLMIRMKFNNLKIHLIRLRLVLLPFKVVFCIPGFICFGLFAMLSVLINRNNYENFMSLFMSMKKNPNTLTNEQNEYLDKWLNFGYHISFWFWISLFIFLQLN